MLKYFIAFSLCCSAGLAIADSQLVSISAPPGLNWNESKAYIVQQGVRLMDESFISPQIKTGNDYLAASIPKAPYKHAIYKFSFDSTDKLDGFGIYLSEIDADKFAVIKKDYDKKYGAASYRKQGADSNGRAFEYLNWGRPAYGYIGMSYYSDSQQLLIAYFPPVKPQS